MKQSKIAVLAETAVCIAILIIFQFLSAKMGQLVTGSIVNFILILSALVCGVKSGIAVAALSPFIAKLIGIGPAVMLIVPFVALGNIVLVLAYGFVFGKMINISAWLKWLIAIIFGAVLKFLTLNICIVKIVLPTLGLNEAVLSKMAAMFGVTQLFTALIGGVLAFLIVPVIIRNRKKV